MWHLQVQCGSSVCFLLKVKQLRTGLFYSMSRLAARFRMTRHKPAKCLLVQSRKSWEKEHFISANSIRHYVLWDSSASTRKPKAADYTWMCISLYIYIYIDTKTYMSFGVCIHTGCFHQAETFSPMMASINSFVFHYFRRIYGFCLERQKPSQAPSIPQFQRIFFFQRAAARATLDGHFQRFYSAFTTTFTLWHCRSSMENLF